MHFSRLLIVTLLITGFNTVTPAYSQTAGTLAWTYDTGELVYATASQNASGRVFIGSESGVLHALDITTSSASQAWTFATGDWIDSSASIYGNTVYVGSWDSNLYAINANTGAQEWAFETGSLIIGSPAVGADGTAYIGSSDGVFYAVRSNGSEKWQYNVGSEIDSSPAIGDNGNIYFGSYDGVFHAVSTAGQPKWTYTVDTVDGLESRIASSPALDYQGNIYFGAGNGYFYCLSPDGALNWSFQTAEEIDSSPVFDESGNVYFASRDGYLYSLDPNGVENWRALVGDVFYSSAAVDEAGNLYIAAYVGDGITAIYSFTPNGELIWDYELPSVTDSSIVITNDGLLLIGAEDGNLYAIHTGTGPGTTAWPKFGLDAGNTANTYTNPVTPDDPLYYFSTGAETAGGWYYVPGVGFLNTSFFPWCFHETMDWFYAGAGGSGEYWLWHLSLEDWVWTTETDFPNLFSVNQDAWIAYFVGDNSEQLYWVSTTDEWIIIQ
ncbi:PQQ-binding-like beta-propeller repeat protein [Rubellicoccus peritrichatus]|uniref:PQQ-binding-like beta-propeller repeat protein n=1 Tax=Rubellicoccus peritrichatus TaxID=3080537 RepID=A0AAQ3LCJ6_9BACT|nr:PQQ-binding-like beta-propeller repeat protein [Puniceicoccus sp. CR14]WOO43205.1 PQQ-binding-like beta-propeller repeat protein [Puniceicoccus sp. CR14]